MTVSISEASPLQRAISTYKAGRLFEAEQLCHAAIAERHGFFDALLLLAVVQSALGKKDEALASYDRALEVRPHAATAHFKRGQLLGDLKQLDEALASYDRALTLQPGYALVHFARGNLLSALGRNEDALASYARAIALRPDLARGHGNRGAVLHKLGRYGEALASFDCALNLRPNLVEAYYNRGNTLQELKRFGDALASYDRALKLQPNLVEALSNRGNTLQQLKRYEEALLSYDRAVDLQPDFAPAWSNRGNVLAKLKRYDDAVVSYDRALSIRPQFSAALSSRGIALRQLKRFEEALASFDRAIAASPQNAEAHFAEAEVRLLLGDFERGWQKYEWRSKARQLHSSFAQSRWGEQEEIAGKTILIHAEQGFGDTVQFCRYVPLLAHRGARLILQVQPPLRKLMMSLAGATQIVARGDPLPDFDMHCPLLSLPLAFGTHLQTIPSTVPYLASCSDSAINWHKRLASKRRPWIGLAWAGRTDTEERSHRSIPLSALLPLLETGATFISLQKDVPPQDTAILDQRSDILRYGDKLQDFSDTAALISNLDLVISIDTGVAHLAGALAKPVWVLLAFVPDWRWLLDRDDSPWYPTARLFRQDDTRQWDCVIARVCAALKEFVHIRS